MQWILKNYMNNELLTDEEYAYLSEQGYLKCTGNIDGLFKSELRCVYFNEETKNELLKIGDKVKNKYKNLFNTLKKSYASKILAETPAHLKKVQKYFLQHIFYSDSAFTAQCLSK